MELRTQSARLEERMETRQAEYRTDIGNLAADLGRYAAKSEADLGKYAAKSEADLGKYAAEYKTDIGNLAADLGKYVAKSEADLGKYAAENKADIGDLKAEMARRETRMLLSVMGALGVGLTLLGVFG